MNVEYTALGRSFGMYQKEYEEAALRVLHSDADWLPFACNSPAAQTAARWQPLVQISLTELMQQAPVHGCYSDLIRLFTGFHHSRPASFLHVCGSSLRCVVQQGAGH